MESVGAISSGHDVARHLLDTYFKTNSYPYTRHHIDSYDQFLSKDLGLIVKNENPILILKERIGDTDFYKYKVEIFVGGQEGNQLLIGLPTITLQGGKETRLLFPNEARLRNLTYSSTVYANILVKVTYTEEVIAGVPREMVLDPVIYEKHPLFRIPVMLHSRYCSLHNKPKEFLEQAGECPQDHGGYFIIDGGERVIVSRQEQAFNTLYITKQNSDPKISFYSTISCFSQETRRTKRVSFAIMKDTGAIKVMLPFVRTPVPLFVLFRALGIQTDKDIVQSIFPDLESAEAKMLMDLLEPSVKDAFPFLTKYSAIQFIKVFTKGFAESTVLDIIYNQTFTHVENQPGARIQYLGQVIRKILRVVAGLESETDKDSTRNQRCLVSGFSTQMLFQDIYKQWKKLVGRYVDYEFNCNPSLYKGLMFRNIFSAGNANQIFVQNHITDALMKAFRGKWGSGLGEEKAGLIQVMSRLSYLDFMSHCRRVVLDFDTGLKLTGPRHLHPSQFGYYCTNETPGGASIGITKNLSILTTISTGTPVKPFQQWLGKRGFLIKPNDISALHRAVYVPVEINSGLYGYTTTPLQFVKMLKCLKHTGWLPPSVSVGFDYHDRRVFIYMDEGRPIRPLIIVRNGTPTPMDTLRSIKTWRDAVLGTDPARQVSLSVSDFVDPLAETEVASIEDYIERLTPYLGYIEYVDPYEQNLAYVASFHELADAETTHIEVHPSTMLGAVNSLIPFLNHNQSPRNQLGCSQTKQALSMFASNFKDRYDNQVHLLCYPQAPITRTMYANYLGEGRMNNGHNILMALATYQGYNQEDGIVFNADSVSRGLFRSIAYRSYEGFEEDDPKTQARTRFGNPKNIPSWNDINPNLDYSKLNDDGFIKVGEYVDETTVIMGAYMAIGSKYKDSSITPQVWTRGRVEEVVVMYSPTGLRLVKVRIVQDRSPELGDKFTNRHGQKGTIGMLIRAEDMPRLANGQVPDVIVNPHCIPSRMTVAQLLEQLFGKAATKAGTYADATAFMNEGSPADRLGDILEKQYGIERAGNEIMYNGITGEQIPAQIFACPLYFMRLKHMTEDKWNARGEGRREQRTHQPTGGRGQQGGLKIGEMDRDAILCHGVAEFFQESLMKRSDGTTHMICNGCGTFPIYNERLNIRICPLCDGPVKYVGDSAKTLEILPPIHQSRVTFSKIAAPYVLKLLEHELETYLNMGLRILTTKGVEHIRLPNINPEGKEQIRGPLPNLVLPEPHVPDIIPSVDQDAQLSELQAAAFGVPTVEGDAAQSIVTLQTVREVPGSLALASAAENMNLLGLSGAATEAPVLPLPEASLFQPSEGAQAAAVNAVSAQLATMKQEADALTVSQKKQYYVVSTPTGQYALIDEGSITTNNILNIVYPIEILETKYPSMLEKARTNAAGIPIQLGPEGGAAAAAPVFMAQPGLNGAFQQAALPGAPPTFVVDTRPEVQEQVLGMGGGMRSRSRSPRRLAFRAAPAAIGMPPQQGGAQMMPTQVYDEYDDGGGPADEQPQKYSNVVTVNKLG
jgi:DNA-directed RNA polymerase II subunit RPB2